MLILGSMSHVVRFSENFQASNEFPILLEWLVDAVQDGTDAHRRLFSLLIMRRLLQSLSGEHQIDAANKMLHAINFADISDIGKFGDDENTFDEVRSQNLLMAYGNSYKSRLYSRTP